MTIQNPEQRKLMARSAAIFAGLLLVLFIAAAVYDTTPDAEMLKIREAGSSLRDESNLIVATFGVALDTTEPPHAAGRRVLESKAPKDLRWLSVAADHRDILGYGKACRVMPRDGETACALSYLPLAQATPAEISLADRYRALASYSKCRSEWSTQDVSLPSPTGFFQAHTVLRSTRIAAPSIAAVSIPDLVADVHFLRDGLACSDSLIMAMIFSAALAEDYRLAADVVASGSKGQIEALRDILVPLSPNILDLQRVIPYEYEWRRHSGIFARQRLLSGEDPLAEAFASFGAESPLPSGVLARRWAGLWLKPELEAKAMLNSLRASAGPQSRHSAGWFEIAIKKAINRTGPILNGWATDDRNGGLSPYETRLRDLDYYIRLVQLVATLAPETRPEDPSVVVDEWNARLPADAQDYRLYWDMRRAVFGFHPQWPDWKSLAKKSGRGVEVSVPLAFRRKSGS